MKPEYPMSEFADRIIGCCFGVYRTMGPGFAEVFYQRALVRDLQSTASYFGQPSKGSPSRVRKTRAWHRGAVAKRT